LPTVSGASIAERHRADFHAAVSLIVMSPLSEAKHILLMGPNPEFSPEEPLRFLLDMLLDDLTHYEGCGCIGGKNCE